MALTRITKGVIKPNENYDTHDINSTGIITATGANITGNMTVGGVLTYEDVTSIDSVGLITARNGIDCNGDLDVDGHTNLDNVSIAGVTSTQAVNFATNARANFAANNRLQIHSNGTNSYIDYGGSLNVRGSSGSAAALSFQSNSNVLVTNNLSINGDLDVDGHTNLDNVSISGVVTATSFVGNGAITINNNGTSKIITGSGTANTLNANVNLTFDGTTLDVKSGNGVINTGQATVHGDLDVDGHTNLDNVSIAGVTTFSEPLTLSKDANVVIDFSANSTSDARGIYFNSRCALSADYNDGYLRLNNQSQFSNGVYTPGVMRADGGFRVDSNTVVNSSGFIVASRIAGTLPALDGSNLTGITQTTINSNADNRVVTGSGTANTLNAESNLTFDGSKLGVMGSPVCTIDASSASDALQLPNGTTGERPSGISAANSYGMMRYNESLGLIEKYDSNGWGVIDNPPVVSGFSGIINQNNSTTITVTGSNFKSGAVVSIGGAAVSNSSRTLTTSYSNSSTLTANTNASSVNYVDNASFNITVTNPSGLSNTLASAGTIDSTLTWSTSAGSLGTWNDGSNSNSVTVSASDPDGTSVTYALTSGSLPPSTSLNTSTGVISTSGTGNLNSNTTYSFTITATSNSISVARAFSITVNQTKDGATAARATSPDYLRNTLNITTDGNYWVKVSPMSSARQMYINFGMRDSKDWCLMAHWNQSSSNSGSLQYINAQSQTEHRGYDVPWKGFLFDDDGTHYYSYFSSYQSYNDRGAGQGTTSGGNKSGYQVFIGGPGKMGFYNTGQSPCNWSSDNGMVGSGYDGTCGTYPTNLRFGFGYDSDPFIDAYITGQIKMWIWMDNKQPS